ncbi:MAG: hypothetical protein JNL18_13455 [Planctomycetaceae bacterium]|nr:hypothetical protein [Planctomycetaceae bacterium]
MSTDVLWSQDANVIEFEPRGGDLGEGLRSLGLTRYLAVTASARLAETLVAGGALPREQVSVSDDARRIRCNNADLLILNGWTGLKLAHWRCVRHAEWVAVPLRFNLPTLCVAAIGGCRWLSGNFARPRVLSLPGSRGTLLCWRNRRRAVTGARRFIPFQLGVQGFLAQLVGERRQHVILRWFESLPTVAPGEDLDLLIADDDLEAVEGLLASGPGLQAVDLYTTTGLPRTDFRSLPYYPPAIAQQLLNAAIEHRGLCRVPTPEHHFLSLAYHALYHKGFKSGLQTSGARHRAAARSDHDYADILRRLGAVVGYSGDVDLESLDAHLATKGWRPSHDMMVRLARHNKWLRLRLANERHGEAAANLAVFLLRERGLDRGGVVRARRLLEHHGFQVTHAHQLDPTQATAAARAIRGGNWGAGPWPVSGGLPAAILIAHDANPMPPTRRQLKKYPFVVNARTLCKDVIRDEFNRDAPNDQRCNVIHSSDNGREAIEYIEAIYAERATEILDEVQRRVRTPNGEAAVLVDVTKSGRRAKVEVVNYNGRFVVKKTFKPQMLHFLEREVRFLAATGGKIASVPPLVARGDSWFMIPYYDDVLQYRRSSGRMLPLDVAKQAVEALRDIYDAGFALVDASMDNLLVDRREGLKLFDFEFSHQYDRRPKTFEESYDVAGCPSGFEGDLPIQGSNSYERNWQPYIGLSLNSLLYDSPRQQRVKRALYFATHAHRFLPRRARGFIRAATSSDASIARPAAAESVSMPQSKAA